MPKAPEAPKPARVVPPVAPPLAKAPEAPKPVTPPPAPVVPVAAEVLRRADPLVVDEHEGSLAPELLGEDAHGGQAVVAALVEAGVPSVVLTRGAKGALVATPGRTVSVPSPRVEVVDTTGAGDFLAAGFGDSGRHAPSAVSAASLPLGVAVEIEAIFALK